MKTYLAILHDGTFDGDSLFFASGTPSTTEIPCEKDVTLKELLAAFESNLRSEGEDAKEAAEEAKNVAGAWVLDERGQELLQAATDQECGSDSAAYALNSTAKRIAEKLAVRHVVA